jgi:peptidoglycan/xylan/chitin deacetylase (PgdA/CDA1 family)
MKFRKWIRGIRRKFEHRGIVLMYHRVADIAADPWELAVKPDNFEQQLKLLKKKFNVIPVSEMVSRLSNNKLRRNSIAITFDDGYNDNYTNAMPILEKYGCPASFFVATKFIGNKKRFWWDELQNIFFETARLPEVFSMQIGDSLVELTLDEDVILTPAKNQMQKQWSYYEEPPTRRCLVYYTIWEKMRPLPHEILQSTLSQIHDWANNYDGPDALSVPLSSCQLKKIGNSSLFELGLHTESHVSLSSHPSEVQQKEITGNMEYLEGICSSTKRILTYPYGDYDLTTQLVAKNISLDAAFTTNEQVVTNRSDRYSLGRFQVKNWDYNEFDLRLREWLKPS